MKKQRKYRFKGVRGISKVLTYYYKKRYSNTETLKSKAREINQLLTQQKLSPTVENILQFARKKQKGKQKGTSKTKPTLPDSLSQVSYYFELSEYPRYILSCTNEIYFTSNLWDFSLPEIQGGTLIEYSVYFSDYVNYINGMKSQTTPEEKKYETEWLIKCTEPVYNPTTKRWESKIVSVDGDEDLIDYGFDSKNPKQGSSSLILSQKKNSQQQKTQGKGKKGEETIEQTKEKRSVDEIKAETELEKVKTEKIKAETEKEKQQKEKIKQENIKTLMELFKNKDITKLEFKEMMNDIKNG